MEPVIEDNAVVLFLGDLNTDGLRNKENPKDLGAGFVNMAAGWFSWQYSARGVRFVNGGLAGLSFLDAKDQYLETCMRVRPTWVSLMAGIVSTVARYKTDGKAKRTPLADFEEGYRDLLSRVKKELNPRFILCEPWLLPVAPGNFSPTREDIRAGNYPGEFVTWFLTTTQDRAQWREELDPKIQLVRKLAKEYEALLIPMDGIFADACNRAKPEYWAPDGVHPTPAANALLAHSWLKAVQAL